jgi:hypothetical protein
MALLVPLSAAMVGAPLHKGGPDCLFTKGMLGGNVKEFLHGLWLFVAELMHQGLAGHARLERQYNTDVIDLQEFMPFLGETSDVIPQGLPLLLLITLKIRGIVGLNICGLEVFGKDPPSKVIEPCSRCVSKVDGVELDDE